jgi:predicted phosphodiesterase
MDDLIKSSDENYYQYVWRVDNLIRQGKYKNWKEVTPIVNKYVEESDIKGESGHRSAVKYARDFYEAGVFDKISEDGYVKELQTQKRELEKTKKQIQTEKLEYNRWLREESRDELITEKIVNEIKELEPLDIPEPIEIIHNKRTGILVFGDEHFGTEFELKGLFGEVINSYSPEIFEHRMNDLLNQTVEIVKREGFSKIKIFNMGDFTDGCLRVGQLMKLRYGVVEGTVKYSDFICNWLNKLSNYVNIELHMVNGNHSELRMLGQQKGTFSDDNMGIIVFEMIKNRLKDNLNFELVQNPTGLIFDTICGYNVLGIHGEVKNMESAIKDFSNTYNVQIDILIAGHLHHSRVETVGINKEVINAPSIIGIDSYSLSLNKTSNAGATFIILEDGKGKIQEYNIKLD